MYKSIRTIQKEAITALKDRRGIYILMFTLNAAIALTLSATRVAGLVGTLLSVLLQVGMNAFALKLCCGMKQEAQFNDLFFIFSTNRGQVGKTILLYLIQLLFIMPASIIYAFLIAIFAFAETKAVSTL